MSDRDFYSRCNFPRQRKYQRVMKRCVGRGFGGVGQTVERAGEEGRGKKGRRKKGDEQRRETEARNRGVGRFGEEGWGEVKG